MAKKFGNLYLDTDILRQFDFDIHKDPRWVNLKAKEITSKIFIPKIVLDEWNLFYCDVLKGIYSKLGNRVQNFNKYIKSKITLELQDYASFEKEMLENILENIKMAGIEVFDNSFENIEVKRLIEMAIHKVRPFQEEGKGFKDAIILFTILEHCKQSLDSEHFFLTNNKNDFDNDDIRNLITAEGVDLQLFFSIEELNKYFDKWISREVKKWMEDRREKVKSLLLPQKDIIIDFIRQKGEFDDWFLKEGSSPFAYSIEKIEGINFLDILDPMANFLEEGVEEGDVEVSFTVRVKFNLLVRKSTYETPKHKIGESVMKLNVPPSFLSTLEKIDIEKNVIVKGKIHIKMSGTQEHFSKEIQLEEVPNFESPFQRALLGLT